MKMLLFRRAGFWQTGGYNIFSARQQHFL